MSQKSILTIVVGLLVFVATLVVSIIIFVVTAASGAEIMDSPQAQAEKLQLAGTIQTSLVFIAVLELSITGVLAYQWRKSDIPARPYPDDREESQRKTFAPPVQFSVITGILAFVTSYVASLLDVFVFDIYGGLNFFTLICTGLPAGLLGMLGGFIWRKVNKKPKFTAVDLIPLIMIGIAAGLIPGACIKLLPQ